MVQHLKRSLFTLFFLGWVLGVSAQDTQYFVYIQSERSQVFYVRYNDQLIPSSDKGYVILSKMPSGTANIRIGFAKSETPEQQFQIRLSGQNDQGYLLKSDGKGGHSLYNLQTFAMIRPSEKEVKKEPVITEATPEVVAAATEVVPEPTPTVPADSNVVATTEVVPASPVNSEEQTRAMMGALKKDLDSTFPTKEGTVSVGPGTRPVKQASKFSEALDKVVKDDRPEEIVVEEPVVPVVAAAVPAAAVAEEVPAPTRKQRKKRREREPLTEEEQQLLTAVMAEEKKAAATEPPPAAAPAEQPVAETPVPAATEPEVASTPVPEEPVVEKTEKKEKKQKKKKAEDPAFIDFMDTGGHQAPAGGAVAPVTAGEQAVVAAQPVVEEPTSSKKKKRSKLAEKLDTVDMTEHPNNIVTDTASGYAVEDLSIDHPKESRKDRKKKKAATENVLPETMMVAPPAAEEGTLSVGKKSSSSSVKMINSDCGKVMDDDTFRKVLRKFVAGKDEDGMIDIFRKQTKGYCLESSQIRTLTQLLQTDDSRYRLLDQAYPKAYDSEEFAGLVNLLQNDYYKGRFKAMLHK